MFSHTLHGGPGRMSRGTSVSRHNTCLPSSPTVAWYMLSGVLHHNPLLL
jgi:hypothetical protein